MRFFRPRGRADACRVHSVCLLAFSGLLIAVNARADQFTGVVVDPHGRPLPRAHISVRPATSADTEPIREAVADGTGRFTIDAPAPCRIEAALAGFQTITVECGPTPLRVELPLAPVEETVIVSATRTAVPARQTGLSTTTFSAEDLARRQTPLVSDLLRTSVGAMVLQTGGNGGETSLFMRGGESSYNAVLLDGIPLNEPGGTFSFSNVTTEGLDRVEVVRGANSSLFGSDAMSSVVQMFTRRGASNSRPQVSAQIDGGTYNTLHANAAVSGGAGAWDYSLGAARYSTDNREPNNTFDNNTVLADVGRALGSSASLRFVGRAELGRTGTPGQTAYGRPDLDAYFKRNDLVGGVTFEQALTPTLHQRASYSLSSSNQKSVNLIADPDYTPSYPGHTAPFPFSDFTFDVADTFHRHFGSYQADWHAVSGGRSGDHLFTLLADWNGERATLEDHVAGTTTTPARDNVGISLQHQMLWRAVATTAGFRVEHNDSFGTAVVPRGSVALTVHRASGSFGETLLRAAAGGGIKEPTLLQSFSTSPYFQGNPDLQPERSRAFEVGVEQRLASDRFKVDATWFDNRYRNIIGLRSTGGFNSQYFNIGLTSGRGAELSAEVVPHPTLHIHGGYTFLASEILESTSPDSPLFAVGNWAFRRPRHSGYVEGAWSWQRVGVDVTGVMVGRFVDSDFSALEPPITENPGHTVWNARASYALTSTVTGLVTVDNLTDRDYQEPLGYPALRRAFRAGVRVAF